MSLWVGKSASGRKEISLSQDALGILAMLRLGLADIRVLVADGPSYAHQAGREERGPKPIALFSILMHKI